LSNVIGPPPPRLFSVPKHFRASPQ
jgi:hypothetical protein